MDNIIFKVPLYAVHSGIDLIKSPTQRTLKEAVEFMVSRKGCYLQADRQVMFLKTRTRTEARAEVKIFVFGKKMTFADARKKFAAHANVIEDLDIWEESGFSAVAYNPDVKRVIAVAENTIVFSMDAQQNILKGKTSLNGGKVVWREPIFRPFSNCDDIESHLDFTLPHAVGEIRFNPQKYLGIAVYEKVYYDNGTSWINKALNHVIFQDKIVDKNMLLRMLDDKGMLRSIRQSKEAAFLVDANHRVAEIPKPYTPLTLHRVYAWVG